jgi:hypothetical protein
VIGSTGPAISRPVQGFWRDSVAIRSPKARRTSRAWRSPVTC